MEGVFIGNFVVLSQNLSSRFTGDGDYKPLVCSDPDVTTVEMDGSEDFLVIACDGLWDTVTPEEATEVVFSQLKENKGKGQSENRFFSFPYDRPGDYFYCAVHTCILSWQR